MDISIYENRLRRIIEKPFKNIGFSERKHLFYTRDDLWCKKTIAFGGRIDNKSYQYMFGCTVGVRFIDIEKMYRPEMINEVFPTIMTPLHLLHKDRFYDEWLLDENESEESIYKKVIQEIEIYAFPFYERYSVIENIKNDLESNNPEDWFILSPEQRICILGIIYYIQGDLERSLVTFDNALEERKDAPIKKRRLLERIRDQIYYNQKLQYSKG